MTTASGSIASAICPNSSRTPCDGVTPMMNRFPRTVSTRSAPTDTASGSLYAGRYTRLMRVRCSSAACSGFRQNRLTR
jgi:hypothetical protein